MSKSIDTCIKDVYDLLSNKEIPKNVDPEEEYQRLAGEVVDIMRDAMAPDQQRSGRLRLSNVGKPDRQIYNEFTGISGQDLEGTTRIKFLYGHLTEALLVSLLRLSGHSVTDQQKEVKVGGVKGHIDCYIDGTLVDIKSASSHGFKKFKRSTLHKDDPFGYIGQLKAYAHGLGEKEFGWLAMDKTTGELALLKYDTEDKEAHYAKALDWSITDRITHLKAMVQGSDVPVACYAPIADGTSGNFRLTAGCVYCKFREHCWPSAREFAYSGGHKFFTTVVREPRVMEVPKDF